MWKDKKKLDDGDLTMDGRERIKKYKGDVYGIAVSVSRLRFTVHMSLLEIPSGQVGTNILDTQYKFNRSWRDSRDHIYWASFSTFGVRHFTKIICAALCW
ncbi:hypothetical protein RUM43_000175 [Polyplax serrata]|uniref:Uncharacterized protein n=1 Tax=Polyplax serrata TaxID=468196 RepID=A0AAN8SGE3_POLSC